MKIFTLQRRVEIPRLRDDVFAFFARPENLAMLMPPALRMLFPAPAR